MKTIVYVDVLFLINFIINMILIKITQIFLKRYSGVWNLCVASAVGAIYAVCMFFPRIDFLYIFPFKMLISSLMIMIVYPKSGVVRLIRSCAVFYLVSFTFAGILLALIYFTGFADGSGAVVSNGIFYFDISLWKLAVTSAIAYLIIKIASAVFSRNKLMGIRLISISVLGRECTMPALSDTGNLLTDPVTNSSVVIADKKQIEKLFPEGVPDIKDGCATGLKLRVIPYSSLGNESGMMLGFVPDKITVDGKIAPDVIVGISENALSASNEYNALFNPNILNKTGGR